MAVFSRLARFIENRVAECRVGFFCGNFIMSKSKDFIFSIVAVALSLSVGVAILEAGARLASFSTGTGTGNAAKRWFSENWRPVNALGYRDDEIDAFSDKPRMVFLGDSFTAGQGVMFEETFYHLTRRRFDATHRAANIGRLGASTQDETKNLAAFLEKHGTHVEVVVHQYLVNDIDDYTRQDGGPSYRRSPLRTFLVERSELANLIDNYFFIRSVGRDYMERLFAAYRDPIVSDRHLRDLAALHGKIHASGARIVFVLFPFLNNRDMITRSAAGLDKIKAFFHANCRRGDTMLDVLPIASRFTDAERVVNLLDPHPSKKLHAAVADELTAILSGGASEHGSRCENR
jgi:hypothetical protein